MVERRFSVCRLQSCCLAPRRGIPTFVVATSIFAILLSGANASLFAQAAGFSNESSRSPVLQKFRWRVVEYGTDKPVVGAKVVLRRVQGQDSAYFAFDDLSVDEIITDAEGFYSFSLDLISQDLSNQWLRISITHPDYVPTPVDYRYGLSLNEQLKNYRADKPIGTETIKLHLAREVQGILHTPDGKPAAGVIVKGLTRPGEPSKVPPKDQFRTEISSKTDEQGRFRLLVAAAGTGRYWFCPTDYAPRGVFVDEKTIDAGIVTLEPGFRPKGRVVDANGKPVPGMTVRAGRLTREIGDEGGPIRYERSAATDADGRFQLDPIGPATYQFHVDPHPIPAKRTIFAGVFAYGARPILSDAEEIELRALPTVDVRLTTVDTSRQPATPLRFSIMGRIEEEGGQAGGTSLRPEKGVSILKIPQGLREAQLTFSELPDVALLFKRDASSLYEVNPRRILFKRIDEDLHLEVMRFQPTRLRIKVTDATGNALPDVRPQGIVRSPELVDGQADVEFYKQETGTWRSQPLIAIGELTITADSKTAGRASKSVTVVEGQEQEVVLILKLNKSTTESE